MCAPICFQAPVYSLDPADVALVNKVPAGTNTFDGNANAPGTKPPANNGHLTKAHTNTDVSAKVCIFIALPYYLHKTTKLKVRKLLCK